MGGVEDARYISRYGTRCAAKIVLISAVSPLMLQPHANPEGLPMSVPDDIRTGS
jgi:non-heme chloroperoxidase